mmetsp:Transcript_23383/g.56841  ORF Transcript_23383/g.56841 Transcript_23383/m.56841 type:complete len:208 (-) Transcript_23383:864-1487(-)
MEVLRGDRTLHPYARAVPRVGHEPVDQVHARAGNQRRRVVAQAPVPPGGLARVDLRRRRRPGHRHDHLHPQHHLSPGLRHHHHRGGPACGPRAVGGHRGVPAHQDRRRGCPVHGGHAAGERSWDLLHAADGVPPEAGPVQAGEQVSGHVDWHQYPGNLGHGGIQSVLLPRGVRPEAVMAGGPRPARSAELGRVLEPGNRRTHGVLAG